MKPRAPALAASLALLVLAWWFRWDVYTVPRTSPYATAYVLDHWTGQLYLLAGAERHPVTTPEKP